MASKSFPPFRKQAVPASHTAPISAQIDETLMALLNLNVCVSGLVVGTTSAKLRAPKFAAHSQALLLAFSFNT